MERTEILNEFYGQINEDDRLIKSRQSQLKYLITINYIHRFLKEGACVPERYFRIRK